MKKLILTVVALMAVTSIYAQGTVNFVNNSSTPVTNGVFTASPGVNSPLQGTTHRAGLYYGPAGSLEGALVQIAQGTFIAPGRYNGGVVTTPLTTPPGGTAVFQVRVYDSALGANYEASELAAIAGGNGTSLYGKSQVVSVVTGQAPPNQPVSLAGLIPSFAVNPVVPEPSSIALGVLGGLGLLFFRRRK